MLINKKILGLLFCAALVLVLPLTASAAIIGDLNLNPSATVNQSGNLTLSGSCGNTGANGNVTFQLNNNGSITTVGSSTATNSTGGFTGNVTIPNNFTPGSSTLQAVCPNGDLVTSAVNVNVPIGASLTLNGTPTIGQSFGVSGSCGTTAAGTPVTLNFVRMIGNSSIGSTTTTGANGDFSSSFNVAANAGGGPVQIVATCPSGTVTFNTSIVDPNANVNVGSSAVNAGGSVSVSGVCGNVSGRPVTVLLSNANRQVSLGSTFTTANGSFSSNFAVPGNFPTGSATIVAFCPTGNVVTASANIGAASTTGNGSVLGTNTNNNNGASGRGTSNTPVGGVAAGMGTDLALIIALALLTAGIVGFLVNKRTQSYSNNA